MAQSAALGLPASAKPVVSDAADCPEARLCSTVDVSFSSWEQRDVRTACVAIHADDKALNLRPVPSNHADAPTPALPGHLHLSHRLSQQLDRMPCRSAGAVLDLLAARDARSHDGDFFLYSFHSLE